MKKRGIILKNALKELLLTFSYYSESAFGASRYKGVKSSLIPEQNGRIRVSRYGMPRYHGIKLVGALQSDRFIR